MIARVRAMDVPQDEAALTDMVPAVAPGVTRIELLVENPLQPVGRVQVYVVPGTFVTL